MKIGDMVELVCNDESGLFLINQIYPESIYGSFQRHDEEKVRECVFAYFEEIGSIAVTDKKFTKKQIYFDDLAIGDKFISEEYGSSGLINTKIRHGINREVYDADGENVSRLSLRSDNNLTWLYFNYKVRRVE